MRRTIGLKDAAFLGGPVGGGGGGGFTPADLPGMKFWFRSDVVKSGGGTPAVDTGDVGTWTNQGSAVGEDAIQPVGGNRPTYHTNELNGHAVVRFASGSTTFLYIPHSATTDIIGAFSYFCVVKANNNTDWQMLLTKQSSPFNPTYELRLTPTSLKQECTGGGSSKQGITSVTLSTWTRLVYQRDTSDSNTKMFLDGASNLGLSSLWGQSSPAVQAEVGRRYDGLYGSFDLVEWGFGNANWGSSDRDDLETYLKTRYNLA